jgi:hypothetical protein
MIDATGRDKAIDRLREIQGEIGELLDEALHCIRDAGGSTAQADAYWKAHIICALRNDHEYLGGSMVTMQDTIEELESGDEPSPDDDGDED